MFRPEFLQVGLQVGGDVGEGLGSQAEHVGGEHEGALQLLDLLYLGARDGLHLAGHGFDDHGIALRDDDAVNDLTALAHKLAGAESVGDVRRGIDQGEG